MTTIRVRLLPGRYSAGPEREWPPEPARLFYAAVATWGEGGSDPSEREALLWWERLAPPIIVCSGPADLLVREDVGHFVPINDVAVVRNLHGLGPKISEAQQRRDSASNPKERAKADRELAGLEKKAAQDSVKAAQPRVGAATDLGIMPDNRPKQLRNYPTVRPGDPIIDYEWPDVAVPTELIDPLETILGRIGRLGHPSTLVHCELISPIGQQVRDVSDPDETGKVISADSRSRFVPHLDGDHVLRVQAPDLLDELEIEFESHRGRAPRALPHGSAAYRWSDDPSGVTLTPVNWERCDDQWLIMEIERRPVADRWRPGLLPTLNVSRATDITRALRGALLRFCADPIPPVLSGHRGDRPNEDAHAMFLALPNAGSTHSDGSIGAVVLALPRATTVTDIDAIEDAVQAWYESGGELWFGDRAVRLREPRSDSGSTSFDARRYTTTRSYWARPSRTWTSVTPIALDRFPRAMRGSGPMNFNAFDDQVAELVTRACEYRKLPAPQTVRAISGSPMVGIPPVGSGAGRQVAFPPYRTEGTGQVRFTTHLQLGFERPVRGPLILGSGRHFGFGLFLPSDRGRGAS